MSTNAQLRGNLTPPELSQDDLSYFCKLIKDIAGIHLNSTKQDLVSTRLRIRITALGLQNFSEYRSYLSTLKANDAEWEQFTNLLTTNKTDFFREPRHFEFLIKTILPEWLKTGATTFKAWSAASSTGEEAFTLAMVLDRYLPKDKDFRILGTDIDTSVIATAQNAVYPSSRKTEIPPEYHSTCLGLGKREAQGYFRIKPHLKDKIVFKTHNLIEKMAPSENTFDLVLCRNVLIYFESSTIEFVQNKLFLTTKQNGHLFIGHSESLQGIQHRWQSVEPSVFKKKEAQR